MQVTADAKAVLRREILSAREKNSVGANTAIWREFIKTDIYADCEKLLTYVSVKNEPDTLCLIEHALSEGKQVFVPKTYGGGVMSFYRIQSLSNLTAGRFGIPEPRGNEVFSGGSGVCGTVCGSVCVIPALCYNSALHRIGYGGGYYDRFLHGDGRNTTKVLFCDVFREFTADVFDVPADIVVNYG